MGKRIGHIAILFLLCFWHGLNSQSSTSADSIPELIERAQEYLENYQYEKSLSILKSALQASRYNQDDLSQAEIYRILGNNFESTGLFSKAKIHYGKGLTFAEIAQNVEFESKLNNDLGRLYTKMPKHKKKAAKTLDNAYKLALKTKDSALIIKPLLNAAALSIDKKAFKTSLKHLSLAKNYLTNQTSLLDKTRFNNLYTKYYVYTKKNKQALSAIHNNIALEAELDNNSSNKKETIQIYTEIAYAHKTASEIAKNQKDFQKALDHRIQFENNINRSSDLAKSIELQKALIKFDVGLKDEQLRRSKKVAAERDSVTVKWQISIILGIVVILISLAFLISSYKNNLQKKKLNSDLIEKNKELVTAKETAEQVSTLKSQFISTVSHELRTPLYGVIGLTSLLMENPENNKRKEYLDSLKFSGDYLLALINDVLQLSKIESNEVTLEKVPFNLKTLIEGIVNSLRSKQEKNNNEVHIIIDKKIDTNLMGDSVRLSQVLINLIGNALKFTKNGNIWITIDCKSEDKDSYKLNFSIKDDGIGIPDSKQKTIFDNFAQVKNENQEYAGTGLGLAIVRKLIHLHDSEIFIKSEESNGSEFYFDLVFEKALSDKKVGIEEEEEDLSIGTSNFNILIVDDNKINQIVTQNILKKKGYTCELAGNGVQAVEKVKESQFDLVLMDINMPEMNGLEATAAIRTFNTIIPIIALTAVEEGEIREEAISIGMNDVIIKPYDTQQFFQTIIKNISRVKLT